MSESSKIHVPDVPLGRLIRMPGGKTAGQAIADAEQGLASLQGESMKELNRVLAKAETFYARADGKFCLLYTSPSPRDS